MRAFVKAYAAFAAYSRRQLARPSLVWLRPLLHLFGFYPLLLAVVAVLFLLASGRLMDDYDAFHVLWHSDPGTGMAAGSGVGLVLAGVMLAVFVLDRLRVGRDTKLGKAPWPMPPAWAYWAAWTALLVAAALPAVPVWYRAEFPDPAARLWFPLGLLTVGLLYGGTRLLAPGLYKHPTHIGGWVVALLAVLYLAMAVVHDHSPETYCPVYPAAVCALLLVAFVTGLLGVFTLLAGRVPWLYPLLIALLIVPFLFPSSLQPEYRLPHMEVAGGAGTYYDRRVGLRDYGDRRVNLHDYDEPARAAPPVVAPVTDAGLLDDAAVLSVWNERMKQRYGEPQPVVLVTVSGGASASALYCADVLFTLEQKFPGFSDRVRLISGASGGMLGAAYFVSQLRPGGMLERVRAGPEFRRYAEAYYEARQAPWDPDAAAALDAAEAAYQNHLEELRPEFFRGLERDFLGPIVQKWVHRDMPLGAVPTARLNDRGSALEAAWGRHLRAKWGPADPADPGGPHRWDPAGGGALDVPFRKLRDEEAAGAIPSLVFTPMMVEDGRQLIVSNLDLDYMVNTVPPVHRKSAHAAAAGVAVAAVGPTTSHTAVEFYRLFPHADGFRLSTAVRMNASFPYFSPSAALPTNPVRHVVDAGYYDNYGTTVATRWVAHHADWLSTPSRKGGVAKPAEVILLQVRCFGYEKASRQFVSDAEVREYGGRVGKPADTPDDLDARYTEWGTDGRWSADPSPRPVRTEGGLFSLTAPLTGLFASWRANMVYRADERVDAARVGFHLLGRAGRPDPVRFSRYVAECRVNPSLNWELTADTRGKIYDDVKKNLTVAAAATNYLRDVSTAPPPGVNANAAQQTWMQPRTGDDRPATRDVIRTTQQYQKASPSGRQALESTAGFTAQLGKYAAPPKVETLPPPVPRK